MMEVIATDFPKPLTKPAGGVRTAEDAQKFLAIADELFGADWADSSLPLWRISLLASLLKALGHGDVEAPATETLICRMALRAYQAPQIPGL